MTLDDEKAWKVGNPALDDFLHRDALRSTLTTTREASFRRYRLGQWVGQVDRWLPWGAWEALSNDDRRLKESERVWLAFDSSASGDPTALVGCTEDGHLFIEGLWENPGDPRRRVPREEVTEAVAMAFLKYQVVELACDPWGWRSEIEAWARVHGQRRVVEFNTGAAQRMAPATDRLFQDVVTGACTHDGDERFAAHLGNCVAKPTPMGDLGRRTRRAAPARLTPRWPASSRSNGRPGIRRSAEPREVGAPWCCREGAEKADRALDLGGPSLAHATTPRTRSTALLYNEPLQGDYQGTTNHHAARDPGGA